MKTMTRKRWEQIKGDAEPQSHWLRMLIDELLSCIEPVEGEAIRKNVAENICECMGCPQQLYTGCSPTDCAKFGRKNTDGQFPVSTLGRKDAS